MTRLPRWTLWIAIALAIAILAVATLSPLPLKNTQIDAKPIEPVPRKTGSTEPAQAADSPMNAASEVEAAMNREMAARAAAAREAELSRASEAKAAMYRDMAKRAAAARVAERSRASEAEAVYRDMAARDAATRVAELSRNVEELKRLQVNAAGTTPAVARPASAPVVAADPSSDPSGVLARSRLASASPAAGSELDRFKAELKAAAVAWNIPPDMLLDDSAEIELRISMNAAAPMALASRIAAEGSTKVEVVEVSKTVIATIDSPAFEISPAGAQRQPLFPDRDNIWKWVIKPKVEGQHVISLRLESELQGDAKAPAVRITSLSRKITVKVSQGKVVLSFIERHWEKLLTVVLLPLGVWGAKLIYARTKPWWPPKLPHPWPPQIPPP